MTNADGQVALLEGRGHLLVPAPLPPAMLDAAAKSLDQWLGQAAGSRNLLAHPPCREMAIQLKARLCLKGLLDASSVAVQCTLFDKTPERNWLVALHQDTSIPASADGMLAVIKEGEPYVQPPIDVLQSLVAAVGPAARAGPGLGIGCTHEDLHWNTLRPLCREGKPADGPWRPARGDGLEDAAMPQRLAADGGPPTGTSPTRAAC